MPWCLYLCLGWLNLFFLEFLQERLIETIFPRLWQVKMLFCCHYRWMIIWWGMIFLGFTFLRIFLLALPFFTQLDRGLRTHWILYSFHVFLSDYSHNKNIFWATHPDVYFLNFSSVYPTVQTSRDSFSFKFSRKFNMVLALTPVSSVFLRIKHIFSAMRFIP